jgi:hypothetical protein
VLAPTFTEPQSVGTQSAGGRGGGGSPWRSGGGLATPTKAERRPAAHPAGTAPPTCATARHSLAGAVARPAPQQALASGRRRSTAWSWSDVRPTSVRPMATVMVRRPMTAATALGVEASVHTRPWPPSRSQAGTTARRGSLAVELKRRPAHMRIQNFACTKLPKVQIAWRFQIPPARRCARRPRQKRRPRSAAAAGPWAAPGACAAAAGLAFGQAEGSSAPRAPPATGSVACPGQ